VNRYVVLIPEDCPECAVEMPWPLVADKLREDIVADIRAWYESLPADASGRKWRVNRHKLCKVPEVAGLRLTTRHLETYTIAGDRLTYSFNPPTILTVDEWFERAVHAEVPAGGVN
jgi:hypothetical protein